MKKLPPIVLSLKDILDLQRRGYTVVNEPRHRLHRWFQRRWTGYKFITSFMHGFSVSRSPTVAVAMRKDGRQVRLFSDRGAVDFLINSCNPPKDWIVEPGFYHDSPKYSFYATPNLLYVEQYKRKWSGCYRSFWLIYKGEKHTYFNRMRNSPLISYERHEDYIENNVVIVPAPMSQWGLPELAYEVDAQRFWDSEGNFMHVVDSRISAFIIKDDEDIYFLMRHEDFQEAIGEFDALRILTGAKYSDLKVYHGIRVPHFSPPVEGKYPQPQRRIVIGVSCFALDKSEHSYEFTRDFVYDQAKVKLQQCHLHVADVEFMGNHFACTPNSVARMYHIVSEGEASFSELVSVVGRDVDDVAWQLDEGVISRRIHGVIWVVRGVKVLKNPEIE